MSEIAALISNHLDIWTAAIERKNGAGRGGGKRVNFYGIERLRALILDLAVRGKLVPQDANDEPAMFLLERIAAEGASLAGSRGRRASKQGAHDEEFEVDVALPAGWQAVPLSAVATIIRGVTYGKSDARDDAQSGLIALLRAHNIQSDINLDKLVYVPVSKVSSDQILKPGDIVVAMSSGSADLVGKAAQYWFDLEASFGAFCGVIRPVLNSIQTYLAFFCKTPFYRDQTHKGGRGIGIQNLSKGDLEKLTCLIPPEAEQRRIVAKVDELMAVCDALEEESAPALAAHQTLVGNLLATLVNSADAADLAANWIRLETHFDTLFTIKASVHALKQTILELAVSGRLAVNFSKVRNGTLDDVGDWVGGNGFPKHFQGNQEGDFAFLKVSDMNLPGNEREITMSNNWVSADALRAMRARAHPVGTIIFPKIGGAIATNKRRILAVPAAIDNNCAGQIPREGIDVDWLFMVLSSIDMTAYQAGTSVPALNMKRLGRHPVAIPSIEAQREVVAKVDVLLALCDGLNGSITEAEHTQMRLADAIVERAAA